MGIQTCFGGACDGDSAVLRCFVCGDVGAAIMFADEESYYLIIEAYSARNARTPTVIFQRNKIIRLFINEHYCSPNVATDETPEYSTVTVASATEARLDTNNRRI